MREDILPSFDINLYRAHQSMANGCPITRTRIHMLAPQAHRTVVGIPITNHTHPTVPTHEIFFHSNKGHTFFIKTKTKNSCHCEPRPSGVWQSLSKNTKHLLSQLRLPRPPWRTRNDRRERAIPTYTNPRPSAYPHRSRPAPAALRNT